MIIEDRGQNFRFDIEPMGCVRTTRRQMHVDQSAKRYASFKQVVKLMLQSQFKSAGEPTRAAISVPKITFYMPIPKDGKTEKVVNGKRKRVPVNEGDLHTKRPDIDNLCKSVMDIFNNVYWYDDCQVCHIGEVKKVYSNRPGIEIEVVSI